MSEKFKLNAQVYQKNIFNEKNIQTDIIISRAFKPLPVVFELATKNFKKFKDPKCNEQEGCQWMVNKGCLDK